MLPQGPHVRRRTPEQGGLSRYKIFATNVGNEFLSYQSVTRCTWVTVIR